MKRIVTFLSVAAVMIQLVGVATAATTLNLRLMTLCVKRSSTAQVQGDGTRVTTAKCYLPYLGPFLYIHGDTYAADPVPSCRGCDLLDLMEGYPIQLTVTLQWGQTVLAKCSETVTDFVASCIKSKKLSASAEPPPGAKITCVATAIAKPHPKTGPASESNVSEFCSSRI